jgi:pSer/pThr/pTyr-binding forkhead associated (FHA) protein
MGYNVYRLRNVHTQQVYTVPRGEFLVGRESVCHIVLQKKDGSRLHARFFNDGEKLWVRDLGSSNGTYLQDQKISTIEEMQVGQKVSFANEWFAVDTVTFEDDTLTLVDGRSELGAPTTEQLPRPHVVENAPVFEVPIAAVPKPRIAASQILPKKK